MGWCRSTSFAEGGTGDEASRVGSNGLLLFHAVSRVAADGTENLTSSQSRFVVSFSGQPQGQSYTQPGIAGVVLTCGTAHDTFRIF